MGYQFDQSVKSERERLAAIQASRDPFTIEILDRIGVAEGWHCAEIGAGAGSMTEWLCRQVGQSGKVLATDREIKLLETIEADNLTVRKHDVASEDLEVTAFDLLLARKVLEHLREPVAALRKLFDAVRPGGWLVIEDTDLATFRRVSGPERDRFEHAYLQFLETMCDAGFQPTFGVRLGDELRALGLQDVQLKGITVEWNGGDNHPVGKVYRMTFERIRERVLSSGRLTEAECDQFFNDIQFPDFHAITGVHFGAWGKKAVQSDEL